MKILNLILLTFALSSSFVFAAHPKVFKMESEGVTYSCHPADEPKYCPLLDIDVVLGVYIRLSRMDCLNSIVKDSPNLAAQINECFSDSHSSKFFEDLLLYDVPLSCLKKNLAACVDYSMSCREPPCGKLGEFVKQVKGLGFEKYFTKADGESECRKMLNL